MAFAECRKRARKLNRSNREVKALDDHICMVILGGGISFAICGVRAKVWLLHVARTRVARSVPALADSKNHAGMVIACGTWLAGEPIAQRDKGIECNDAIRTTVASIRVAGQKPITQR